MSQTFQGRSQNVDKWSRHYDTRFDKWKGKKHQADADRIVDQGYIKAI